MSSSQLNGEIITTIGPSSINIETLKEIKEAGGSSFRINLSHSNRSLLQEYYEIFQDVNIIPSIDTQGAQVRTIETPQKNEYLLGEELLISASSKNNSFDPDIVLNHPEIIEQISIGDRIRIDSDGLIVKVVNIQKDKKFFSAETLNNGIIYPNKAVDVIGKPLKLKSLTNFDKYAIKKYANKVETIYLSFVNNVEDIFVAKDLISQAINKSELPRVIAKIESIRGIINLENIVKHVDGILVDRGDLSREVSISRIPIATKSIIDISNRNNTPCYVATNVLDSMIKSPLPSRAEISDLYNLLHQGVSGIVLAAEVAIGNYPVECVHVVNHMTKLYKAEKNSTLSFTPDPDLLSKLPVSLANWL